MKLFAKSYASNVSVIRSGRGDSELSRKKQKIALNRRLRPNEGQSTLY